MNNRINISIGGKWHFYDIVAAAYEEGLLDKFYTTIYSKNDTIRNSFIGKLLKLRNRYSKDIPSDAVVSNAWPEIHAKICRELRLKNDGESLYIRCKQFDEWTRSVINPCAVFHSQDGFCLETARYLLGKGSIFICDRGIISASYLRHLSETEYSKYGIDKSYSDCYIEERAHKEHLLATEILVPTQTVKQSLVQEGIDERKITIIPYGVDLDFFGDVVHKDTTETFNVLFVGEISFRKGCHYLLDAWEKLSLKDANLTLIGHIEKEFNVYLKNYKGKNYHIINYISQDDLKRYYSSATVFILPSLAEGSARVIYEAMACSIPVIYTEMSGSIARNGIDGFEIPAFNTDAIIEKLRYVYRNIDDCIKLGRNGKEWVKNYSKEKYRENIKSVYKKYIKS